MMNKKFKPMTGASINHNNNLLSRGVKLKDLTFPKFSSVKMDGIRAIFHPRLGLVSRSLKPIRSESIHRKFKMLKEFSAAAEMIIDGEFYVHNWSFQKITSAVMTHQYLPTEAEELDKIQYHVFDVVRREGFHVSFRNRIDNVIDLKALCDHNNVKDVYFITQSTINTLEDCKINIESARKLGYEGVILRNPQSGYKMGRATSKSQDMLKYKPFETFDAKILYVEQGTIANPLVEKTRNELGESVTSKKIGDRILVDMASAFAVNYEGKHMKVTLSGSHDFKRKVWTNRNQLTGKWIEFNGMEIGSKDVPRHPVFLRFRPDKDLPEV